MKTFIAGNLRTILVAGVVGVGVYAHGLREQVIVDRYARLFYADRNTLWSNQWFGIPTWQNPNDAWIIQEIISEVKPDYIIEAGTFAGGSAALWATILREVNPAGKVITIDIEDHSARAKNLSIVKQIVTFLIGSSTDAAVVSKIAEQVKGKHVLVILDSNHARDHVLKEIEMYAPLVNVGSYVVVQDSSVNGHPVHKDHGPGPMEAIESFLASTSDFQPDADRERLLHTTNPRGYLKRVK
jgi:cephalosporin hydroxylase